MKPLNQYIEEKLVINKNSKVIKHNYHPKTRDELKQLVKQLIEERGNEADLNDIDVSNITDMAELFENSDFNGDISEWDVSNVENMQYLFYHSKFNGDISKWNVSNVKDMQLMFYKSEFTGENTDISKWDVSNVTTMRWMFRNSKFNNDISNWKINKKCDSYVMFKDCPIEKEYKPKRK